MEAKLNIVFMNFSTICIYYKVFAKKKNHLKYTSWNRFNMSKNCML